MAYPTVQISQYLSYQDILRQIPINKMGFLDQTTSMEKLEVNGGNGQSYGYVIYRIEGLFPSSESYRVSWPRDLAQLIVDGVQWDTGYHNEPNPEYIVNRLVCISFSAAF
jgi:hypothetical protein